MPTFAPTNLRPLFKWTGGKRRELPQILSHLPHFVFLDNWRFVEPFVGGGAVFWALGAPESVINDADADVINFYRVMARQDERFLAEVEAVAGLFGKDKRSDADRDRQAAAYYTYRDLDRNGGLEELPDWKRAARFFIVNQLAFSGMRRFNSNGEFNVPFGHYKSFNASTLRSQGHVDLLTRTTITVGSYEDVLDVNDLPDTFIFIDPPYTRVMKSYSAGEEFGDDAQRELASRLKSLKNASWMVVIDKSPLTVELYADYIVDSYELSYGVNIKNRFSQESCHIVATNYLTLAGAVPPVLQGFQAA